MTSSLKPQYQIIEDYLRKKIMETYSPGDKIPSENELAKMFGVSRLTARKAIEKLVNEGLVVRIQGLGTFVADVSSHLESRMRYVGILIQDKFDERGWSLIAGIERTLEEFNLKGLAVDLDLTNSRKISERLRSLLRQGIVGLIISPTDALLKSRVFEDLVRRSFPIVFVDRRIEGLEVVTVESNNYQGGFLLGKHLRKDHKIHKALFIAEEPMSLSSVRERFEGFRRGLRGEVKSLILKSLYEFKEAISLIRKEIEAIFFCHDLLAVHGMTMLMRKGILVPEDLKVVSFDDREVAKYTFPPLTTVKQDFEALGEGAALMIAKMLMKEKVPVIEQVPVRLVVRKSCGCD